MLTAACPRLGFKEQARNFCEHADEGWVRGVSILHFLGGSSIDLAGHRAIAQTKMTISQRGPVHDIVCDVLCCGRFYDFFEKREGRWAIVFRQPIYEKDRMDPVDPSAILKLDQKLLDRFPEGLSPFGLPAGSKRFSNRRRAEAGRQRAGRGSALRTGKKMARGWAPLIL